MPDRTIESIRKFYAPYFERAQMEGYELCGDVADVKFLLGEVDRLTADNQEYKNDRNRLMQKIINIQRACERYGQDVSVKRIIQECVLAQAGELSWDKESEEK